MRYLKAVLSLVFLAALTACNSGERPAAEGKGSVVATTEFVRHFGPAPSVDKGTAYAFVIYFPSAREPGKVIPFPFFSFDEASLKRVALGRLVSGMGELKAYQGEISNPFPSGTRLLDVVQAGGEVTAHFSKELALAKDDAARERALIDAVVLTVSQFAGVTGVTFRTEGTQAGARSEAKKATEKDTIALGAPRLLSVTAMREKGESGVKEVDAFFDRPVHIDALRISGPDGKAFEGDTYLSVFDMAGVLKPKQATGFTHGMPVTVRWKVTDKLGRSGSGESELPLEVREH